MESKYAEAAKLVYEDANDYNDSSRHIATIMTQGRNSILRDLSTAGLAYIAAAITLLTIPDVVKSPTAMALGTAIIGVATASAFAFRRSNNEYLATLLMELLKHRNNVKSARNTFLRKPDSVDAAKAFSDSRGGPELPARSDILEYSDKYVGILMLVGVGISLSGLFLYISF